MGRDDPMFDGGGSTVRYLYEPQFTVIDRLTFSVFLADLLYARLLDFDDTYRAKVACSIEAEISKPQSAIILIPNSSFHVS